MLEATKRKWAFLFKYVARNVMTVEIYKIVIIDPELRNYKTIHFQPSSVSCNKELYVYALNVSQIKKIESQLLK